MAPSIKLAHPGGIVYKTCESDGGNAQQHSRRNKNSTSEATNMSQPRVPLVCVRTAVATMWLELMTYTRASPSAHLVLASASPIWPPARNSSTLPLGMVS